MNRRGILGLTAVAVLVVAGCARRDAAPRPGATGCPIRLDDATASSRVVFVHADGSGGQRYIVESMASGAATLDYDGDGLFDLYLLSGVPLEGTPPVDPAPRSRLFRNLGGFRFADVTDAAGIGDPGYGLGVAAGDIDDDGHPDLVISTFGPKVVYHNNGDGTFRDDTARSGIDDGSRVGGGVSLLDADADGDLDVYFANYVDFTCATHVPEFSDGFPVYTSPKAYDPLPHALFRNDGDGRFTDVSIASGIAATPGPGMGTITGDVDDDGDTDVFVMNDGFGNFCWLNDGHGRFTEGALAVGLKFNGDGAPVASMGVDAADVDGDGRIDFFETTYQGERPVLFRNLGGGDFEDVTRLTGVGEGTTANVKWGCGFADFDNDAHPDILYVEGHIQDNVAQFDRTTSYEGRAVVLRNRGDGRFTRLPATCGSGLSVPVVGRGTVLDDLDGDGLVDAVITSSRRSAVVLRNASPAENGHVAVLLRGTTGNRDAVGARVTVTAAGRSQVAEVVCGRGYQGHFGTRLSFGIGAADGVERIVVRWPGGETTVIDDPPHGCSLVIRETGQWFVAAPVRHAK
ncbi:MAG: CRTAC1 family protein [Planctomycetes bacterium]|nr:CRTAC1 family protein [Planctomycetota bacterium]MBM4057886.1 CRTAC1 family protein [Planctomycetota bacterium]